MHYRCPFFFVSLLLLGLCASPTPLWAQAVTFTHLTTDDGLPSNVVLAMLQDHRGYLWFGTRRGGLVRYDGYEMKVYRHVEGDSTSLGADFVYALHETDDGTLWVGTRESLSRFDAATQTFKTYQHVPGDSTSLSPGSVHALHETDDGTLWVGTGQGLSRFDAATETFKTYRHVPGDSTSLSHDLVEALHESADGTLWVGTGDGLSRFDAATETFKVYQHVPGDSTSLSDDRVHALHQTDDGVLWVGTRGGLNRFDAASETFEVFRHVEGDPTSLSLDFVRALHETDDGTLWVATQGGGLNRFDAALGTFEVFRHVEGDPTSLSHDRAYVLHQADDGTLWVGTWGGGLNRFDAASGTFEVFQHVEGDPTSLSNDVVGDVLEADDGTLWVGTIGPIGGSLHRFDATSGTFKTYPHVPGAFALHETDDGMLWLGGGGLHRFDAAMETFKTYRHVPSDSTSLSLSPGGIRALHETDDGMLWVGTSRGGLSRFDAAAETFKTYRHVPGDSTSLSPGSVHALHETDDGTLWVGNRDGLSRFDAATETFKTYRHVPGDSTSLSQGQVNALHETRDGTLWIGTEGGLNRLEEDPTDPTSVSFTRFLAVEGNPVMSILEDEQNQLWLGLYNGRLIRFNPETRQARYFGKRYGVPSGGFLNGTVSRTGRLYWANQAGLVSLRLDRLPPPGTPPKVQLSALWVFDEPLTPGPDSPLKQALWQTESLQLSHGQNDLTFGFVGLHYADPEENRYQYRLLGYDRNWRSETDQRRATYTNLPPGDYTFEVKASNSDGIWTPEAVRLGVEILPPWWRTVWAYAVYGLFFIGGLFVVDRVQRKRLLRQERERTRERELAQAREIKKAHTELQETHTQLEQSHQHLKTTQDQLIQSEKMASLGALTAGIAHEIKNPLNFVNNFAEVNEELLDEVEEELAENPDLRVADIAETLSMMKLNASKIHEQGQRADGIVQSMMQHASDGSGEREATDVNALVEEYINLAYHGKRAQTPEFNVEIVRELGEEVGSVAMVPQEMGRVCLNLLVNAFDAVHEKALSAGGAYEPVVTVSTRRNGEAVEICVCDNGVGIPQANRQTIFEPFFTTKPAGSGTGLGLSLSYDIITKGHGGTLTVESEEDRGASFIVRLPVKKTGPAQR